MLVSLCGSNCVCFPVKLKYLASVVQEKWKQKAKTVSGLGWSILFWLGKTMDS